MMLIKDRLLFLKYALPCARTLVKRGKISQENVNSAIRQVAENNVPETKIEGIFKVAKFECSRLAKKAGKTCIDSGTIRRYFLLEHNKIVDERFELMKDFDPSACKTYAGQVARISRGSALVETPLGRKRYKTDFCKDVKKNDSVAVHFDYIIERISDTMARRMLSVGNRNEQ